MPPRSLLPIIALAWLAAAALAPAQDLTVGSPAPALDVEAWLKGEPVTAFAPGRVYLVEFWATWCAPCIAGMPRLTELQAQLGDSVTVIGVNIWEEPPGKPITDQTRARVARFVAENDAKMGYRVAFDGGAQGAAKAWLQAAGLGSIPQVFIVDGSGVIAHIGPLQTAALRQVIAGTHDLAAARAAHEERRRAEIRSRENAKLAQVAVAAATSRARAGDHAGAVALCDRLEDPDDAKIGVFRALCEGGEPGAANGFVDHLLQTGGLGSPRGFSNLAWNMVDPDHGVKGADPARAVLCSERALVGAASEPAVMRPLLMDTHAMALAAAGRLNEAIAAQAEAVALETNATMKALMQERLDAYRARR